MDASNSPHLTRRIWLAGAAAALAVPARAACAPARVLFVCRFGSVKSAYARELMRQRAAGRGVAVHVVSRGLTPDDHADPAFLRHATADGLDLARQPLTQLRDEDALVADIVVSFEPPADAGLPSARDWSDTPSMLSRYADARAAIAARVDTLLDELVRRRC